MDTPAAPPPSKRPSALVRLLDSFTLANVREALFEWSELTAGERIAATVGYGLFVLMLVATLALEWLGRNQPGITYALAEGLKAQVVERQIAWVAVGVVGLGFVAGWAYLFVSLAQFRWFGLALGAAFFVVLYTPVEDGGLAVAVFAVALALWVGGLVVARWRGWQVTVPYALLAWGMVVLGLSFAGYVWMGPEALRGIRLNRLFSVTFWFTEPVWIMAGLALIQSGIAFGQAVVTRLRPSITPRALRWVTAVVLAVHPLIAVTFVLPLSFFPPLTEQFIGLPLITNLLLLDFLLGVPLALAAVVVGVLGRWNARMAGLFLSARLALFVYSLAALILESTGFDLSDPVFGALGQIRLLPSSFIFAFSLVLTVLGFFAPFANNESPRWPRRARVPLVLGAALITCTVMLFFLQARDVRTGEEIASSLITSALFSIGSTLLGLPFLVYTAVRRPADLIGPLEAWQADEAAPVGMRRPRRVLLAFVLGLPLVTCACGCALMTLSLPIGVK